MLPVPPASAARLDLQARLASPVQPALDRRALLERLDQRGRSESPALPVQPAPAPQAPLAPLAARRDQRVARVARERQARQDRLALHPDRQGRPARAVQRDPPELAEPVVRLGQLDLDPPAPPDRPVQELAPVSSPRQDLERSTMHRLPGSSRRPDSSK